MINLGIWSLKSLFHEGGTSLKRYGLVLNHYPSFDKPKITLEVLGLDAPPEGTLGEPGRLLYIQGNEDKPPAEVAYDVRKNHLCLLVEEDLPSGRWHYIVYRILLANHAGISATAIYSEVAEEDGSAQQTLDNYFKMGGL